MARRSVIRTHQRPDAPIPQGGNVGKRLRGSLPRRSEVCSTRGPHRQPGWQDYEYRREGTRNLFLACEPKAGWRHVAVTERRTTGLRPPDALAGGRGLPGGRCGRVVLDNLNTHRTASLYETFPAAEARRIGWSSIHPQARELVEYGGNRVQRAVPLLPQAARPQRPSGGRSRPWSRSEMPPEPPSTGGSTPRTPQTSPPLSFDSNMTDY